MTIELNPTHDHFRFNDQDEVEFWMPGEREPRGKAPISLYDDCIRPAIERPGRLVGILRENLARYRVDHLTHVVEGDYAHVTPRDWYGLIFSDCTHTPFEIELMVKGVGHLFRRNTVLACHDIDAGNLAALERHLVYRWTHQIDGLHIGQLAEDFRRC